jgi:hypothetical protein
LHLLDSPLSSLGEAINQTSNGTSGSPPVASRGFFFRVPSMGRCDFQRIHDSHNALITFVDSSAPKKRGTWKATLQVPLKTAVLRRHARISHDQSTATLDSPMSTALHSKNVLDVLWAVRLWPFFFARLVSSELSNVSLRRPVRNEG